MTVICYSLDKPRLDWGIIRSFYRGGGKKPSCYTAYLILWDKNRNGADWFKENGEEVAGIFNSRHLYPEYADAFVVHEVNFQHHEVCDEPRPLTDGEVILLACQRLHHPIDFGQEVSEWQSVQEHVYVDMDICVFYNALFLRAQGNRYFISLADMFREADAAFDAVDQITPTDFREDDVCVEVDVPQTGFRVEYCRAVQRVTGPDR